jgi:hypothetical protein
MRKKRWIILLSGVLLTLMCLADIAPGDREMFDAKKRSLS